MLELKSVAWKNFLSYGDYETKLELTKLRQCLVTGLVNDDDSKEVYDSSNPIQLERSNGAGKSTIPSAIQWCLFGRTMHSSNPGNKVINWFTGQDCYVTVEFINGDKITRTRKSGGHNELIYIRNGDEHTCTSDTLSVAKNQQAQLAREFNLDWELFCGSVFFNQFGKPWMEMADQSRKKSIERALHIDKFEYRARCAKSKKEAADTTVSKKRSEREQLENEISRLESDLERISTAKDNFINNQNTRKDSIRRTIAEQKKQFNEIKLPNLQSLKDRWATVAKLDTILNGMEQKKRDLNESISHLQGQCKSIYGFINVWREKSGKICVSCEQKIDTGYTDEKIQPKIQEVEQAEQQILEMKSKRDKIQETIDQARKTISDKKPKITLEEAKRIHREKDLINESIKNNESQVKKIDAEENPHNTDAVNERLEKCRKKLKLIDSDIEKCNLASEHYHYIYKAYNDRNKLRQIVFQDHVPFINARLKHYLDILNLDVKIELTPSLGINSNLWSYDFQSGGERKRTDVAFMLAMFDFHEQMYGRQSNVLVLDEVDGRLDADGIDGLINIIQNDLSNKSDCILIISHRRQMFDIFPHEIKVNRTNRFSQLEVI